MNTRLIKKSHEGFFPSITRGNPWAAAGILGLAGGLSGYYGADYLKGMFDPSHLELASALNDPDYRNSISRHIGQAGLDEMEKEMTKYRRRAALLSAAASASPAVAFGLWEDLRD